MKCKRWLEKDRIELFEAYRRLKKLREQNQDKTNIEVWDMLTKQDAKIINEDLDSVEQTAKEVEE